MCEKEFLTGYLLKKHMEIHVSERRYKCGECGKLYKTIGHVREHMRAHSDERPYHCARCNKGYKTKVTMLWSKEMQVFPVHLPTRVSFMPRMHCKSIRGRTGTRNHMCVSTA